METWRNGESGKGGGDPSTCLAVCDPPTTHSVGREASGSSVADRGDHHGEGSDLNVFAINNQHIPTLSIPLDWIYLSVAQTFGPIICLGSSLIIQVVVYHITSPRRCRRCRSDRHVIRIVGHVYLFDSLADLTSRLDSSTISPPVYGPNR